MRVLAQGKRFWLQGGAGVTRVRAAQERGSVLVHVQHLAAHRRPRGQAHVQAPAGAARREGRARARGGGRHQALRREAQRAPAPGEAAAAGARPAAAPAGVGRGGPRGHAAAAAGGGQQAASRGSPTSVPTPTAGHEAVRCPLRPPREAPRAVARAPNGGGGGLRSVSRGVPWGGLPAGRGSDASCFLGACAIRGVFIFRVAGVEFPAPAFFRGWCWTSVSEVAGGSPRGWDSFG
eukprot:CAMPEP_0180203540 /NCGR_PEP_ID=MMETSP0987-20121128/7907_1 /TAXON_ID=697907 /ORGANISM="non described non described, Strain CCMP2293" /LENGTH=234 /DNA_ID=CAMNT_0022158919 /DNA_START=1266 /DNA_END=1971 /DNA_ORIENTATION=+